MGSARRLLLALVAAVASSTGRAGTIAASFVPPILGKPGVPPRMSAAIVVAREACAAWQPATTAASPSGAGAVPKPAPAGAASRERMLCEVAGNPAHALLQPMVPTGIAGAILFCIGRLVFSPLRGVLISVRARRLPTGAKSW